MRKRKNINRDQTLDSLLKEFNDDFGPKVGFSDDETITFCLFKEKLTEMIQKMSKETLLEEELGIEIKLKELNGKDYLSHIALILSIASFIFSFLLGNTEYFSEIFTVLTYLMSIVIIFFILWALDYHEKLNSKVLYYSFKLDLIKEMKNK